MAASSCNKDHDTSTPTSYTNTHQSTVETFATPTAITSAFSIPQHHRKPINVEHGFSWIQQDITTPYKPFPFNEPTERFTCVTLLDESRRKLDGIAGAMPTHLTIPTSMRQKCPTQQLSVLTGVKLLLASEHEVYPPTARHLGVSDLSQWHFIDLSVTSSRWGQIQPLLSFPCGLLVVFRADGVAVTCHQMEAFMGFAYHIAGAIERYREMEGEGEGKERVKKRMQWLKDAAGAESYRLFFERYREQKVREECGSDWKDVVCHLDV